jgi:Na+/H+ antiporter NhaD/arsenite permease-like protein
MFGTDPFWIAIAVFALTYLLIIAERINRSIIAMLGAGIMIVTVY